MQDIEIKYRTPEHELIFDQTKHIPGWQEPGDSFKLYEMAYEFGDVILEIGTYGGRSAIVELRGALANKERKVLPQFFGIEIDIHGIWRSYNSIKGEGLDKYALLFHGDLEKFVDTFSIKPTMVFVDGDHRYKGVKKDLNILSKFLSPGTPVLCHDYKNPENETGILGVRRAVDEFVSEGFATLEGTSGCSAFLIMSEKCRGDAKVKFSPQEFLEHKICILEQQGGKAYEVWQASEGDRAARLDVIHDLQTQLATIQNSSSLFADSQEKIEVEKQTIYEIRLELAAQKIQIEELKAKMGKVNTVFQRKLDNKRKNIQDSQVALEAEKIQVRDLKAEIEAMKTSKFWKIRTLWFRLKNLFGVSEAK